MGLFRRKKDRRVEEITDWARNYLAARRKGESGPEASPAQNRVSQTVDESPVRKEGLEAAGLTVVTAPAGIPERMVAETEEPVLKEALTEPADRKADVIPVVAEAEEEEAPAQPSVFERLSSGLSKTRAGLVGRIDNLFSAGREIDSNTLEDLEEILIEADIGVQQSLSLIAKIQEEMAGKDLKDPGKIKETIRQEIAEILSRNGYILQRPEEGPYVIMVVGVNGVGKTTTIGKLAWRYIQSGDHVLLAAGDTFRAAAMEQLEIWGNRVGADVVKHKSGADPSAVVFDALKAAQSRGAQVVIADTAGRLHTKVNLMEELKKMKRVMAKVIPGAPHEVLLVLDATTGQNALSQAKTFHEAVGVTGIVLTKLDGTAKGGIVTAIVGELGLPVKLIGIGEGMEDLRDFDPEEFVRALFGES